jgi:hypothetical protein
VSDDEEELKLSESDFPGDMKAPPELAIYSLDDLATEISRRSLSFFLVVYPPETPDDPVETVFFSTPAGTDYAALRKRLRRMAKQVIDAAERDERDYREKKSDG